MTPKRTHQLTHALQQAISLMHIAALMLALLASIFTCLLAIHITTLTPEQLDAMSLASLHSAMTNTWQLSMNITLYGLLFYVAMKVMHSTLQTRFNAMPTSYVRAGNHKNQDNEHPHN
ncbi:hypothetical protein [Vibrio tasmaniensis]|uniref:hypothetical protein n=1 Tax=Vibrio tasmaniensis TaxID=212663 RepID=UPI0011192B93|nr:hypothetical protein [Vibrio tasmaniensis]